ncbi:MAG: GntR family transcriptional regulator [Alphaproteobacteria bacterium]
MQTPSWTPDLAGFAGPRYLALANSIATAIVDGKLTPGARLPTQRQLARRLNLNIGTIAKAYAEAARRGWIRGTVGSGTIALSIYAPKTRSAAHQTTVQPFENGAGFATLASPDAGRAGASGRAADLSFFRLPVGPERAWMQRQSAAAYELWSEDPAENRNPFNMMEDFHHVSRYLSELASARISRDHVLTYYSFDTAIAAVLGACAKAGDRIAAATLVSPSFLRIANDLNLEVIGLHSDEHGLLPESVELACWSRPLRALIVQPDGAFGTGAVMPARRRQQIAEIARKFDVTVLEDGAPGMLRDRAAPSLFSFNAQHVVFLAGLSVGLSRFLNPSFLVFGEGNALFGPLSATSLIDQPNFVDRFLVAECFAAGLHRELATWHKHETHQRAAIAAAVFGSALNGSAAGYQCAVKLPNGWSGDLAVTRLRKTGLSIGEPAAYSLDGGLSGPLGRDRPQQLVFGLGAGGSLSVLKRDLAAAADIIGGTARPPAAKA